VNRWIRGTNSAVLSAAVVVLFVLSTLFLGSRTGLQWDLTANKRNTLSEKTITTLRNLKTDIRVLTFFESGNQVGSRQILDLLKEYSKRTDRFTYTEVDIERDPMTARKYEVTTPGTIVVETKEGKTKKLYDYDMFSVNQDGSYAFAGEMKLTQAIVQLTSDKQLPVYLLSGHGEIPMSQLSSLTSALEGDNYAVKELNLLKEGKVPEDATAVFIIGPQNDLTDQELAVLREYVKGKGKLYVCIGYSANMASWKNIPALLGDLGVKSLNAVAVELRTTLFNNPLTVVPDYGFHETVNPLDEKGLVVVLPGAIALSATADHPDYRATALLRTSAQSYGKTNLDVFASGTVREEDVRKAAGDIDGPLDLAYAVEDKDGKPKAIVVGNALFLNNQLIREQANENFALNTAAWLQENENLVTIAPRVETLQQAIITRGQANAVVWTSVVLYPAMFLAVGGLVWWRRRTG